MMLYFIKGASPREYVHMGEPVTIGGVQYPAGFPMGQIPGAMAVTFPPRPDDRFYVVNEVYSGPNVTYDAKPLPLDDAEGVDGRVVYGLRSQEVAKVKATAGSLLAPTDWMVVRAAEGVKPISAEVKAYRDAIRAKSNEAEAAILACKTVEELSSLPYIAWPESL